MGSVTEPVYLRVLEDLRAQIREGALAPGARVPSRNAIMARYGVGETAAKHALAVLAAEGLIEARAGSGSFVRRDPAPCHLEHGRLLHPGSPFGLDAGEGSYLTWEHQSERAEPPRRIARRLGLAAGELATRTSYLLSADGVPVQLAVSYEPACLTAQTAVAYPEQGPLAGRGVIERMAAIGIQVTEVVEDISVRGCESAEAGALRLPSGARVLVIGRAHLAGRGVVEAGEVTVAADRFHLRYRIPVPAGQAAEPVPAWA